MAKRSKLTNFFISFDIFGHPVGVHYKGDKTYKSSLGALCTLIAYVIMSINFVNLSQSFIENTNQTELANEQKVDEFATEKFYLHEHNIEIFTVNFFDPRYVTLTAIQRTG